MTKAGGHFFKKTVRDIEPKGRIVLVRADYNVPLNEDGTIADDFRITASLPTLKYLHERGAKLVIISHMGRPAGPDAKTFTLEPVATRLGELLKLNVTFVPTCIGDGVKQAVKKAPKDGILLLENLRFHKEEEANDPKFAKNIAKNTDAKYFVQDGFGVVHRAHASTSAITMVLPSVAGLLLVREYTSITNAMVSPRRPLVAILGGAKVSDKIAVIERLVGIADTILIGGAMANTFLKYKGHHLGASKVEAADPILNEIYHAAARKVGRDHIDEFILLPIDLVVAHRIDEVPGKTVSVAHIGAGEMALDIGPMTAERFAGVLDSAKTVLWNGTLGYAEKTTFAAGSDRIAQAVTANKEASSIVGGGDTADFALHWSAANKRNFTHISTGGGASLELMAGERLPGIEALLDA
jgi:phosphoglycerate kinase